MNKLIINGNNLNKYYRGKFMQELTVYHATKSDNISSILRNGFKPSVSTPYRTHWLGAGIYFYEDLYYAVEWNYISIEEFARSYEIIRNECGVIVAKIDIEKFQLLDLNSGIGYDTYRKIIATIEKSCDSREKEDLQKEEDIKTIRIIEKVENKLGIKLFSSFDVISAIYPKKIFKKEIKHKGDFFVGLQKQICVKNENAIIEKKEYEFDESELESLYNLIVANRRKVE